MVRIIPWSLPPVKGGSIGGYTPKVDPTPPTPEPEPPAKYLDFSGVSVANRNSGNYDFLTVRFGSTSFSAHEEKDLTSIVTSADVEGSMSGIEPIDLVGVSSIKAVVEFSNSTKNSFSISGSFAISVDPILYGLTYVGITELVGTNQAESSSTKSVGFVLAASIDSITFYVYNGNGEIIQQEEVTFE